MTRRRLALGAAGEERAVRWYLCRDYEVLARNWRCPEGELDIVLRAPDGSIVFSEVRTRSTARFGTPAESVTAGKQRRLRTLAVRYLEDAERDRRLPGAGRRSGGRRGRPGPVRFDVVSVLGDRIEVVEGAF